MQVSNYLSFAMIGFIISLALVFLSFIIGMQNNFFQSPIIALILCAFYLIFLYFQQKRKMRTGV